MVGAARILPSGPHAFLAEYDSLDDVLGVMARVRVSPPDGVVDIVPAARTILVTLHGGVDVQLTTAAFLDTALPTGDAAAPAALVTVEVVYNGVDLSEVASSCGLGVDDVVRLHSAAEYTVAFCGFVPGFSYMVGLDARLHLPRRSTPRTKVPAGSVAIASEFSAVYPAAGPGGWHLLGTTDAVMWDDDRPVAALLPPGTPRSVRAEMSEPHVDVVSWGMAGSVCDAGRTGRAAWGASRGGAVDLASLALANRLVGNSPDAGAIESSGGLQLRAVDRPVMVAVTGGVAVIDVFGGPPVGWGAPVVLPPGAVLRVGRLLEGARMYVAVRGGLRLVADGVTVGADPGSAAATEAAPRVAPPDRIGLWPGPRLDWFAEDAWQVLTTAQFTITQHGDRVGVRLSGPPLQRIVLSELPSEGMVEGAVQVPPDGAPIVMLADHPVTGGYPVIAVVDPRDLGHLAQLPPGAPVRFRPHRP